MKKLTSLAFTFYFTVCQINPAFAAKTEIQPSQLLNNDIEVTVYSLKKTKHYMAVELGFYNPTDKYVEFTPKEIYLDDEVKYSLLPLSIQEIQAIEQKKPGLGLLPMALGIGLGIAAIGTGISGNEGASEALTIAALSMGGAYILTKGLENQLKTQKLITFENNNITTIKRLPPGMTLGGFLFFPASKHPKSVTVIAKSKSGKLEKKVFDLTQIKEAKKSKRRYRRD